MSESEQNELAARARRRARARLARLEADLAYFQARIEILRDPVTMNQQAQRKAFTALYALFAKVAGAYGREAARP
ncbi:MAG: hypothetical protein P8Y27_05170 [Chromatiaceae bacterium]|jgi:uncharacterized coiled-coil protein SlyX